MSDRRKPELCSMPFDTQIRGVSGWRMSLMLRRNCEEACTGTACIAYCAPAIASCWSVVARRFAGKAMAGK